MSSSQNREDVPFLLFLVPFAIPAAYAILLWVQAGVSATLPQTAFLQVTENPYVFLVGFTAVIIGSVLDVLGAEPAQRRAKLVEESNTIQKIAVIALVLGALSAWYAAGFDPGAAASNMVQGRYVVVFPALLVVFSFLMLPAVSLRKDQSRNALMVLLLLAVPLTVDEVGKRSFFAGMGLGVVLLAAAVYIYLSKPKPK
jgi:cytochrome bd-type quinol oxidase subunit 2